MEVRHERVATEFFMFAAGAQVGEAGSQRICGARVCAVFVCRAPRDERMGETVLKAKGGKKWDIEDAPQGEKPVSRGPVDPANPEFDLNESIRLRAAATDARGSMGCVHGQLGTGDLAHARWCSIHGGWHGWLYACPEFGEGTKREIGEALVTWRRDLQDEGWVRRQLERGVPMGLIEVWRAWAVEGSQNLKDIN